MRPRRRDPANSAHLPATGLVIYIKMHSLKILIADDNPINAAELEDMVSAFSQPVLCADGVAAVGAYQQALDSNHPYELVFLDIMMPRQNGIVTLEKIREIESARDVPLARIIMVTAFGEIETVKRCIRFPLVEYLLKPVKKDTLMAKMRTLGLADD